MYWSQSADLTCLVAPLGMLALLQMELLYKQRGYLLLSGRTQMFIIGIIHSLLGVHFAQPGQRVANVHIGPCRKALTNLLTVFLRV
jgi:hypothetical protein